MIYVPKITYGVGATELVFSLSQRLWEPEEGVGYGDEDEAASGVIVSYVVRYDYAVRVTLRFVDDERVAVMAFVEYALKNRGSAVLFQFDKDDLATEVSVYVESPSVGERVRPTRHAEAFWTWELSLLLRSSTGERIQFPFPR